MVKKRIRSALLTSFILSVVACTNTTPPNNTTTFPKENFQDLDKEYNNFSTKALTKPYLRGKLQTWIDLSNNINTASKGGSSLVREVSFAKYKHPELFCEVVNENNGEMLNNINLVPAVSTRRDVDNDFKLFLDEGCAPSNPFVGEFRVNGYTTNSQDKPAIAMNSSGNFVVTWQSLDQEGTGYGVYFKIFNSLGESQIPSDCGTPTSPNCNPTTREFMVNTVKEGFVKNPVVAMDDSGNFVISWESRQPRIDVSPLQDGSLFSTWQDGNTLGVYAQRFNSTGVPQIPAECGTPTFPNCNSDTSPGSNTGEFRVNTLTLSLQYKSEVAMDSDGDFVIAYETFSDGNSSGILAQRFNKNGIPQPCTGANEGPPAPTCNPATGEFRANATRPFVQSNPTIAMDNDGDFVIAWNGYGTGDTLGIYARRYNSSGEPQTPVECGTPALPNCNSVTKEFRVNTEIAGNQSFPSAAMDDDGDFVISWQSKNQDGDDAIHYNVYAQRYNSDGNTPSSHGTEFRVNTETANSQNFPSAAMDSDGDFVISWTSFLQDLSSSGIYAQRYSSDGSKPASYGDEFLVNTYTTDNQSFPAAAMNSSGGFVVTWQSGVAVGIGQDLDDYGVYGKRYNNNGEEQ